MSFFSFFTSFSRKKTFFLIGGILGSALLGYFFWPKSETVKTFTAVVKKGSIENSIKVIGTAQLVNEQKMRFNQTGKVQKIRVQEGASVKQGDIIAELDQTDLNNQVRKAEIDLANAQLRLQSILHPEKKDILKAQNDLNLAKNKVTSTAQAYESLVRERDNKLQDLSRQIALKEAESANTQEAFLITQQQQNKGVSDTSTDTDKILQTAYTDQKKYLESAEASLLSIDIVFGLSDTNRQRNDVYETYLSAQNSLLKAKTGDLWRATRALLDGAQDQYSTIDAASWQSLSEGENRLSEVYKQLVATAQTALDAVNASIESTAYSRSLIDSHASTMSSLSSQAQSTWDQIRTTLATLTKLSDPALVLQTSKNTIAKQELSLKSIRDSLITLRATLSFTQKDYENKLEQSQKERDTAKISLQIAQETYNALINGGTAQDIQLAKNSVLQAGISLENTKKSIDKYQLQAPFDGVVRQIDFKVGDNIVSDEQKYVYLENQNMVKITTTLDQLDVVRVDIGQGVRIVFDAYPEKVFTGQIQEINSTPTITSGVTSYTAEIRIQKGDTKIFSGMTAKVYVIVQEKKDILVLPSVFITKRNGLSFVLDQQDQVREVETGITDGVTTEIVSGVGEGDTFQRIVKTTPTTTASGFGIGVPRTGAGGASGRNGGQDFPRQQ